MLTSIFTVADIIKIWSKYG